MNEISRRELLRRTGGAVPLLAMWQLAVQNGEAKAQPGNREEILAFAKLSLVLTDTAELSGLNGALVYEYFATISAYLQSMGMREALVALLMEFTEQGTPEGPVTPEQREFVHELMSNSACVYSPPRTNGCPTTPEPCQPTGLFKEAQELISGWMKQDYGCESNVPEIVSVQAVCAADYAHADPKCVFAFICQDIVCLWFMAAIYRDSEFVVPAQTFHYGSALAYVSGLVWPTVGGGTHPYAQCGGEFGYWTKNPEPQNSPVEPC